MAASGGVTKEEAVAVLEEMGRPLSPAWMPPEEGLSGRTAILLLAEKAKQQKR